MALPLHKFILPVVFVSKNLLILPSDDQDRFSGCWVRMWLWRRVDEENLLPHSEQRSGEALAVGGDEGDDVSAAASPVT